MKLQPNSTAVFGKLGKAQRGQIVWE